MYVTPNDSGGTREFELLQSHGESSQSKKVETPERNKPVSEVTLNHTPIRGAHHPSLLIADKVAVAAWRYKPTLDPQCLSWFHRK